MTKAIAHEAAAKAANELRIAIGALKAEKERVQAEREELERRNAAIYALPVSREDLKAAMLAFVDKTAAVYLANSYWDQAFRNFAFPHCEGQPVMNTPSWGKRPKSMTMKTFERIMGGAESDFRSAIGDNEAGYFLLLGGKQPLNTTAALCFLHGDSLKATIEKHFDSLCPALQDAPPDMPKALKDRRAAIDSNNRRIDQLTTRFSEIEAQLDELRVMS